VQRRAGVERAALDCLEGFHEGDTAKHRRSIAPQVLKFGFYRLPDGTFERSEVPWPAFAESECVPAATDRVWRPFAT
jgi:hypothetical protein